MISIVSAYYNRKDLLFNTLKSLENSNYKDFEFITIDDCSDDEHRIEDFKNIFPFLKVIRLEKKDKWYVNPCVVFNKGFKEVKGDIVIIQNPECLHVGDILEFAKNIKENEYFSFGCYSLTKEKTEQITKNVIENNFKIDDIKKTINTKPRSVTSDGDDGWYNHPMLRPGGYHFCSAITKKNLDDMGGFDENFALGIAYDDDEFLYRIRKKNLNVKIIDNPFVAHQWHYDSNNYQHLNATELINRNRMLFYSMINKNN